MTGRLMALFIVVAIIGYVWWLADFSRQCEVHGGEHTTYPYKSMPECWDADGRRIFW